MIKDDCIFCKIASGEIPSYCLYEDDSFKAIMDIEPYSKGHTLIIPKNHSDNLFELNDDDAKKLTPVIKKVANALKDTLDCEGINILQNNGEAAGQTVMHYHVHIIPRYADDNVVISGKQNSLDRDMAVSISDKIKKIL